MTAAEQIAEAKRLCLSGERLPRSLVTALLAIPTDSEECEALGRAAREAAGRLGCLLAQRADAVVRVFCGIPVYLKGAPNT